VTNHLDRDRQLEQALGRAMRRHGARAPGDACVDPERLAAWVDRGLEAGEAASVEAHVSGCARCQALTAALAQTEPVDTAVASPRVTYWRWWLAPIAAAAAATVIWIVLPEAPPAVAPSEPVMEVALADPAVDDAAMTPQELTREAAPTLSPPPSASEASPPPPAPLGASAGEERPASPPAPPRPETGAAEPAQRDVANARVAAAEAPAAAPFGLRGRAAVLDVTSPEGRTRWRVGADGVERSSDAGATWVSASPPLDAAATAGAATADGACWLVGASGAVWLAEGSGPFLRRPFPDAADLVGVDAQDARRATVVTADGRRFRTDDGGATWRQ
jgi:hypothetical protein